MNKERKQRREKQILKIILRLTENDPIILPDLFRYVSENEGSIDQFMEKHDLELDNHRLFGQISALFYVTHLSDDGKKEIAKLKDGNLRSSLKLRVEKMRHEIKMGHGSIFTIEQLDLAQENLNSKVKENYFKRHYTSNTYIIQILKLMWKEYFTRLEHGQARQIEIVYDLFAQENYYGSLKSESGIKERIRDMLNQMNRKEKDKQLIEKGLSEWEEREME